MKWSTTLTPWQITLFVSWLTFMGLFSLTYGTEPLEAVVKSCVSGVIALFGINILSNK